MDRLRLLKSLNEHGLLQDLTAQELSIFLLLVANSSRNGKGKIIFDQIRWILSQGLSTEKLGAILGALEEKNLIRITSRSGRDSNFHGLVINYWIISPRTEEAK